MKNITIPFLEHIGAKLKTYKKGEAIVILEIQEFHRQHLKYIHGGVISTLLDNTGWYAAASNLDNKQTVVTLEIKINYLKPATGDLLEVKGVVKKQGKKSYFVVIELFDGETLVAYATASYAILNKK
jgi:uncharacterized protein (TIGR00369 family)